VIEGESMPLLNYTTSIPAERSVSEIQKVLAHAGASAILMEYDNAGRIIALSFRLRMDSQTTEGGNEISFRLPCDPRPVMLVLEKQRVARRYQNEDQALHVSWRIVKDWVEAQLAIIETRMVTTAQVFLPYAVTSNGQTLYEYIGQNTQLLLGEGNK
jgi:hypothetical protein